MVRGRVLDMIVSRLPDEKGVKRKEPVQPADEGPPLRSQRRRYSTLDLGAFGGKSVGAFTDAA